MTVRNESFCLNVEEIGVTMERVLRPNGKHKHLETYHIGNEMTPVCHRRLHGKCEQKRTGTEKVSRSE